MSMGSSSLAPAFLLSMPQLRDPNFSRTVVLLCRHNEDGAFGLVVNRPLLTTGRVTVNLDPPVSTDRQLEAELEASSWLMSDVDRDLMFNTPPDRLWETAIRRLGAAPATLTMSRGVH